MNLEQSRKLGLASIYLSMRAFLTIKNRKKNMMMPINLIMMASPAIKVPPSIVKSLRIAFTTRNSSYKHFLSFLNN